MLCLFVFVLTLISISEARRVSRTASKKATLSDYTVPLSNGKLPPIQSASSITSIVWLLRKAVGPVIHVHNRFDA